MGNIHPSYPARDYRGDASEPGYETMQDSHRGDVRSPPLRQITERIQTMAFQAQEIASKLDEHANRVHGYYPEPVGEKNRGPEVEPSAALDALFMSLDNLDRALGVLSTAAGRNCTLA